METFLEQYYAKLSNFLENSSIFHTFVFTSRERFKQQICDANKHGNWTFSPAYDLCYSYTPSGKWTNRHQLSLTVNKTFTYEDLTTVAENMGIRNGKHIIEQIGETVSH